MTDLGATIDDFTEPRRRAPKAAPKTDRTPPTPKQIQEALDQTWVALSIYVGTVRNDEFCMGIVAERGPNVTTQLMELAKVNKSVKRALEAYATTGAWGGVFGAVASMVLPILAHHDRLPPNLAARFLPDDAVTSDGTDAAPTVGGSHGPSDVGAGGTRNVDRPDRLRENDASRRDSGAA